LLPGGALRAVRRETAAVSERARSVRVDPAAAAAFASRLRGRSARAVEWDRELQFSDGSPRTAEAVFVLDSLNFSFWPDPGQERWTVEYAGARRRGYFALSSALKRAVEDGIPVCDAPFLASLGAEELGRILGGRGRIPLLAERAAILRENAAVLLERHGGAFANLVRECGGSSEALVGALVRDFPSFRDVASHGGRPVPFLKRAQILVSDLWGAFGGEGLGAFRDMASLTAFADYRVPQVLRSLGVLVYDPGLAEKVDRGELLPAGGPEEVEIRAGAIQGVEAVVRALRDAGEDATAFGIDWWLWNESHAPEHNRKPYHLTRTIWY
jgi:hypothetical protein